MEFIQTFNLYFKIIFILILILINIYLSLMESGSNKGENDSLESSIFLQKYKQYIGGIFGLIGLGSSLITIKGEILGLGNKQLQDKIITKKQELEALEINLKKEEEELSNLILSKATEESKISVMVSQFKKLQALSNQQKGHIRDTITSSEKILENIDTSQYTLDTSKVEASNLEILRFMKEEGITISEQFKNSNTEPEESNIPTATPANTQESSILNGVLDNFQSLNGIKQMAVSLLLLKSVMLSCVISIIFIFYGDFLINKYKLEIKYPKLAYIIMLRKKYTRYYLISNFLILFIIIIAEILFCVSLLTM